MATVFETAGAKPQLAAGLAQGVETLSLSQEITFTLYVKLVLPLDGYVFWVNASLLNDSAIYNAAQYGYSEYNNQGNSLPARQLVAKGSFHFSSEVNQLEDRSAAFNHVVFTSERLIQDFNEINSSLMYVAKYEGMTFAFNKHGNYYKQADLFHYSGNALYSVMDTQLIDSMTGFDSSSVIVSNSLPIWLTLNRFFPMYPSYLVGQNIAPPYASVDIDPRTTKALQQFPLVDKDSNPNQLVSETVKITIYGQRNHDALNFAQYIFDYSVNSGNIGIMNMPVIQDEKLTQSEFGIIAMKKTITFEVNYYQTTVNNLARQLIESAFISLTPTPTPTP